jgi:archaellum component FlaC
MYRQTQLMESQVTMLEQNQKQVGEIVNNIMNQGQSGHESGAALKQNIFNENRRMMLEMMAPITQQLNDMKILYENTKATSTDVESKMGQL